MPETNARKGEVLPNPDPSVITTESIDRAVNNLEEKIKSRIDGMEKAVEVFHADLVRVPTLLDRSILGLREIIEQRLDGMDKAIELLQVSSSKIPLFIKNDVQQLRELHEEKFNSISEQTNIQFAGIATQFMERDKRTEQLSLADKTAIAAALQAQKEAAGAQNESNAAANVKMETNFAKLIDQGQALLLEMRRNTEAQINDLKSRLDKGEGGVKAVDRSVDRTSTVVGQVIAGAVAFVVVMTAIVSVVAFIATRT